MIFHFVRFKFFKHRIHYWLRLFVVIRDTAFKFVRTNVWEEASKRKELHTLDQEIQEEKKGRYFVNFRITRIIVVLFYR